MARFLYRLGGAAFVKRWVVLGVWIALLISSAIGSATLSGPASTSFSIPGTELQEAIDKLQERFPALSASGASANVVFRAPEGSTLQDETNAAAVEAVMAQLREQPKVAFASDPLGLGSVSPDGGTAFSRVTYLESSIDLTDEDREGHLAAVETGRESGLTVENRR